MSALAKVAKFSANLANRQPGVLSNLIRNAGNWNRDWKPGPYPVTEEEKVAAAKKYGLHRDAYEPYPDDGFGMGDYPKLPIIAGNQRDDFYPWDYPAVKRNFGEPIHALEEVYMETRCDAGRTRHPMWKMWLAFFGVVGSIVGTFIYFERDDLYVMAPVLAKQFPGEGRKFYDFPESKTSQSDHHH